MRSGCWSDREFRGLKVSDWLMILRVSAEAGISEEPQLIVLPDDGIPAEGLDQRSSGRLGIPETMDAEDQDFPRLIRLKQRQSSR